MANRLTTSIRVALGWDGSASLFDLDMMAVALTKQNQVPSADWVVFYNQLAAFDGALLLSNDNQTGAGIGDNEELFVQLALLPEEVDKVVIAIGLHQSGNRTFQDVNGAFVRIQADETKEERVRYELKEDFSSEAGTVIGDIRRAEAGWRIVLTGNGPSGSFESICASYGLRAPSPSFFQKKKQMHKSSLMNIENPFL